MPYILLLPIGLVLYLLAWMFPNATESVYSRGIFPALGTALSLLTGWLPFSLAEFLMLGFILWGLWRVGKAVANVFNHGRSFKNMLKHAAARILSFFGVMWFSFLLVWGFNYHRPPFAEIAGLDASPASAGELEALCNDLVARSNELRARVAQDGAGAMRLLNGQGDAFERADLGYAEASARYPVLAADRGRPKGVLLSPIMSNLGISGIYFPWTGEANVNTTQPDCMLPFTTCHEMAHQRGFAAEDEANFLGYLACKSHPDVDFRYSGTFAAMLHAMNALHGSNPAAYERLRATLSEGVKKDIKAVEAWRARYDSALTGVAQAANDVYLKANAQADGVASYGRMVDLLIAERRAAKR